MKKIFIAILVLLWLPMLSWGQTGEIGPTKKLGITPFFIYKKFKTQGFLKFQLKEKHTTLTIRSGAGKLEIVQHDKAEVEVQAEILTNSTSKKKTEKFIRDFNRLMLIEDDDQLTLRSYFNLDKPKRKSIEGDRYVSGFSMGGALGTPISRIHLVVKVPPNLLINVRDNSGDILIQNLSNDLKIKDGSGKIELKNLSGKLIISDGAGMIVASQLNDSTQVYDSSGKIVINEVNGYLKVVDTSGNVEIKSVHANMYLKDRSGNVILENIDQDLTLKDSSGKIYLKNIGRSKENKLNLRDRSGRIVLEKINSQVELRDSSGKLIRK
ncbi:MAG: hypothetical protein AAFU64_13735 [Bacteroidota bacterium]